MNSASQITIREWFALPKAERHHRVARFRAADTELQQYQPSGRQEDETYHLLNGALNDLWPTVPWWWRQ
jgi:hypothetical protein